MSGKCKEKEEEEEEEEDCINNQDDHDVCLVDTPAITLRIVEQLSSSSSSPSRCSNKDNDGDDGDDEDTEDSVGRFVWPTAMPLLRHMLSLPRISHNDKETNCHLYYSVIVELGAGCGVLGMGLAAAAAQHAHDEFKEDNSSNNICNSSQHVILTDHDSEWLERNASLNETALGEKAEAAILHVARLEWGNPHDIVTVKKMIHKKLRDIHNEGGDKKSGLLLVGSDILYNHKSHESLASTLHQLAQQCQPTRIILGFPDRDNDEESFASFARKLFGDAIPPSQALVNKSKTTDKRSMTGGRMNLRVIDFSVNLS